MKHGLSGIGLYWCIVEMLYENHGYIELTECERIAFEMRCPSDMVYDLLEKHNLFENDAKRFWSVTALERLEKRKEKSAKAAKSASYRWDANAKRPKVKRNAIKESKVNKNKGKIENIVSLLNHYCQTFFKPETASTQKHINARIAEGHTVEDFKKVILFKKKEWFKTEQHQYLRPETLFGTKFESYLNGANTKTVSSTGTKIPYERHL